MNDRMMYIRQKPLNLYTPKSVAVIGVGGVGAWVAITAGMSGVKRLILFDSDTLEIHNLNRLPFREKDIGKMKVDVVRDFLEERRPNMQIDTFGNINEVTMNLLYDANIVIDTTDDFEMQKKINDYCISNSLRYFRCGYDGNHITIKSNGPEKVWSSGLVFEGYHITPSWVVPCMQIAAYLWYKIAYRYNDLNFSGDLENLYND